MDIKEIKEALTYINLPTFVKSVRATIGSFHDWPEVNKDYCLLVELIEQANMYPSPKRVFGYKFEPRTNNPFNFPEDENELRQQVIAAILNGVGHETVEIVSNGGKDLCNVHQYKARSTEDTEQYLSFFEDLNDVVKTYTKKMAI